MRNRQIDSLFERYRREGDVEALGRAFDWAAPELLRVARHLCRDEAEAEDAVQASFLTALERAADFDPERRLLPWLLGILANHARELYRGSARRVDPKRLSERRVRGPLEEAGQREFERAVDRAVEELPESYRDPVRLHLAGGLSSAEIGDALGISPGNARVRAFRGLKRLRRLLPAGLATGVAVAASAPRGLAAVRAEVLASAARVAPTLSSTSPILVPTTVLGGLIVSHRLVLISCAAVLLLGGGLWIAREQGAFARPALPEETAEPLVAVSAEKPAEPISTPRPIERSPEPERSPVAAAPDTIRFSGRVTDLLQPAKMIAGAEVWTTPGGATERVRRAVTEGDGSFSFDAAPEEEDTIFIEAPGYAPFRAPVSEQAKENYRRTHGRQILDGGSHVSIGIVELVRGIRLDGRVRFANGRPAVGAELYLFWHGYSGIDSFLPQEESPVGRTAAGGRIELDGRVPIRTRAGEGSFLLVAVAERRLGATPFAALEGRDAADGLEIVLRDGVPLRVRVVDEKGEPVPGVRVVTERPGLGRLYAPRWDRTYHRCIIPPAVERFFALKTDDGGVAFFPHRPILQPDGSEEAGYPYLRVVAEAEGLTGGEGSVGGLQWRPREDDPHASITLRVSRSHAIALSGRVLDTHGAALVGAQVELPQVGLETRTDEAGQWAMEIPAEKWPAAGLSIVARSEGYVDWKVYISKLLRGVTDFEVDDIVLGMRTKISGRVVDDEGRGVGSAMVVLRGPRAGGPADIPAQRSGPDGSFVHEHVPEGEWQIGAAFTRDSDEYVQDGLVVTARGGDEGVVLVVTRRPRHEGRVVAELIDEATGAPLDATLAGVRHAEIEPGRISPTVTVAAGRVTAENLAPGRYQLWAQVPGRALAMEAFEIAEEGEAARLRLPVGHPGSLRGSLTADDDRSFANARITAFFVTPGGPLNPAILHPQISAVIGQHTVDESGSFHLEDLTPGRWRIEAVNEEHVGGPVEVEVRAHEESEIEIPLRPGAVLAFAFGDWPAEGFAEVTLRRDGSASERRTFFLGEGMPTSWIVILPPGKVDYEVTLSRHDDVPPITGTVGLEPGARTRVECAFEKPR